MDFIRSGNGCGEITRQPLEALRAFRPQCASGFPALWQEIAQLRRRQQVIQAQLKPFQTGSGGTAQSNMMLGIVACTNCRARFADGVKFCGRCGNRSFDAIGEVKDIEEISCPRCSAKVFASAKFCGKCGLIIERSETFSSSRFAADVSISSSNISKQVGEICPRCDGKIQPNAKFCGLCGNSLI